jgi:surface protein
MRIFKGSNNILKLFLNIHHQLISTDGLYVVFYTTDSNVSSTCSEFEIKDNFIYVKTNYNTFSQMEDGVINYLIIGEGFNYTRQSNYYLKTPQDYVITVENVQPYKEIILVDNGEYNVTPDDGFTSIKEVKVNVEFDTTNYFNQGYEEGFSDGYIEGESTSYNEGYDDGYEEGKQEVADDAQILNVTQNGTYYTKYSDVESGLAKWGEYNGTKFNDSAKLYMQTYNTNQILTNDYSFELWWKNLENQTGDSWFVLFSEGEGDGGNFQLRYNNDLGGNNFVLEIYGWGTGCAFEMKPGINHIQFKLIDSIENVYGLFVNDEWIDALTVDRPESTTPIYLNGCHYNDRKMNGQWGMFKINNKTFIPTPDGYLNLDDNEYLEVVSQGNYEFIEPTIDKPEGELIKTVVVNVDKGLYLPNGCRLANSEFEEIDMGNSLYKNLNDFNAFFNNCQKLKKVKNFNPYTYFSAQEMFYFAGNNFDPIEFENCDFSKLVNGELMFGGAEISSVDVSNFVTNKTINIRAMFNNSLVSNIYGLDTWDISGVDNLEQLFNGTLVTNKSINNSTVFRWNYANVTNINSMLEDTYIESISRWGWNLPKVTKAISLFKGNSYLQTVSLNSLNAPKLQTIESMFSQCGNLTTVNISYWRVPELMNAKYMFKECDSLETVNFSNWQTSKLNNMEAMFFQCDNLKTVDFSGLDVSNVTTMSNLFSSCNNLEEVKFGGPLNPNLNTSFMFHNINTNGKLYYPAGEDYSKIINALPSTWEAIEY